MLEMSDTLVVLLLDGIRESAGVAAEIDHARRLSIPLNQVKLAGDEAARGGKSFEVVYPDFRLSIEEAEGIIIGRVVWVMWGY